jgi:RNA polymerase sigma-B factor
VQPPPRSSAVRGGPGRPCSTRRAAAAGRSCRRRPPRGPLSPEQRRFAIRHLPLAQQQARRFAIRHGLDYDDLLGAAYEGLCKAALGFEPRRGHRPSSYVVPKVRGELLHHLRDTGFALSISHRLRELWLRARPLLAAEHGDAAIAAALDVPLGQWLECRLACGQPPLPLHEITTL